MYIIIIIMVLWYVIHCYISYKIYNQKVNLSRLCINNIITNNDTDDTLFLII